jgi:hypothetical protein
MINMKRYVILCAFALILSGACVTAPKAKNPLYTQRHYTFSVLLSPEKPSNSPQLDIALSLLQIEKSPRQMEYLGEVLYSTANLDEYKDRIIREQRKNYRDKMAGVAQSGPGNMASDNWWYSETVNIKRLQGQGIVVERNFNIYSGGAHPTRHKRYYVLDMGEHKQLRIDDLFASYQEDTRLRGIIYEELRKYSKLEKGQPLSRGIFFSDEPELTYNFFITDEGLGLHWSPYQIAPYVQGDIEIILPWNVVRPLMLQPGIELLNKFNIHLFM